MPGVTNETVGNEKEHATESGPMDNKVILGIAGVGTVAGVIMLWKGRRIMTERSSIQLSEHFNTGEFLQSASAPDLKNWKIPPNHLENLKRLVLFILEPARLSFGPIKINGGYRPLDYKFPDGKTWVQKLKEQGYHPAEKYSDHYHAGAADTMPVDRSNILPYFQSLIINPHVRQVIMYIATKDKNGTPLPKPHIYNIHVSVATKKFPRFSSPTKHHFVLQDGKTIKAGVIPNV